MVFAVLLESKLFDESFFLVPNEGQDLSKFSKFPIDIVVGTLRILYFFPLILYPDCTARTP